MAIKTQLKDLAVGTIISDKISSTKYIILEAQYKITPGKTSDGVLLGFFSNESNKYFTNQIFESDTLGKLYNDSDIKELLNSIAPQFKTSDRLKQYIMPVMIASNNNSYDLIGPMTLFLPSLIEFGEIPSNPNAIISGVAIDTTNIAVKEYINDLKSARILMRNSYDLDVYLSDNTTELMNIPQNMSYFLCVDPTLYVGSDENGNYYLFDNFTNSRNELNNAILSAETIIEKYGENIEFKDSIDFLKTLIDKGKEVDNTTDQNVINQITQELLDSISLLETQIRIYEADAGRIEQNILAINEIIKMIDDFLLMLTTNGYITNTNIQQEINDIDLLKKELNNKINNLNDKIEEPMNVVDLNNYLDQKYDQYFVLENSINQKIFVNNSLISAITELGVLVQECIILVSKYPLIDKYYIQASIDNANNILASLDPTIIIVQNAIIDLSEKKQQFINSITFNVDIMNPILEIGLFGRRPVLNIVLTNNTGIDAIASSSDTSVVKINSPNILTSVIPLGSAKQYSITGISEGNTTITFELNETGINKTITIPVIVSRKDTIDPSYLDLVEDLAKVSIQQIDSGVKDIDGLGNRLELIEQKLFNSSSTLDANLLNILNTTTPTPIMNNIESIMVKDADIVTGLPTIINLSNRYYLGKQHLMVYRNGVYQQVGIKYKEKTNNSVEFSADYLLPGDRLLFICGNNGMSDISHISVDYTEGGLITKIKFFKEEKIFREIEYIYDDKPKIIKQIVSDELYKFIKTFIYNSNDLVTDITIEVEIKEGEKNDA